MLHVVGEPRVVFLIISKRRLQYCSCRATFARAYYERLVTIAELILRSLHSQKHSTFTGLSTATRRGRGRRRKKMRKKRRFKAAQPLCAYGVWISVCCTLGDGDRGPVQIVGKSTLPFARNFFVCFFFPIATDVDCPRIPVVEFVLL